MSNFDLTVVTLNVRSLTDHVKRQNLFYLLRTWSADVICLQEVHATPALAAVWGRPSGAVPPPGTITQPSCSNAASVLRNSTFSNGDTSYLRHLSTEAGSLKLLTSTFPLSAPNAPPSLTLYAKPIPFISPPLT